MPSFINPIGDTGYNFGDVSSVFENLRISAIRKASKISHSIDSVTIGPDAVGVKKNILTENIENEQNNCNLNVPIKTTESSSAQQNPSRRNETTFSIKKILLENELQRREEVRKAMDKKKQHMETCMKALQQELTLMREILAADREKEKAADLARYEAEEEKLAQQNEIKRRHEQQLHAQRLQERKERLEREAEEHKLMKEREAVIQRIRNNFRERIKDVGIVSKTCKDKNTVSQMLVPYTAKLKELSQQMENINEKARRGELSSNDVNFAEQVSQQCEELLNECASEIARIDSLYEEEIARREHEMNVAQTNVPVEHAHIQQATLQPVVMCGQMQQMQQIQQMQQMLQGGLEVAQPVEKLSETPLREITLNAVETGTTKTDSSSVEIVSEECDQETYQIHQRAKELLEQCTETQDFLNFCHATETKKFRFECQKAINIPVNTISVVSGAHLLEKYNKLHHLLSGQSPLQVNQHPQGSIFCKNLLAKNIVSQGETLVSSKSETAFGIAAVTLALMCDFPDFTELLKAHFYVTCPYLVPFFPSRLQGQSDEEYYQKIGYKYIDGAVEKQTKFLTRMSGIMRLYATIIVTNRRQGVTVTHPLGLENAWRWLAATVNFEVQPRFADITATLILDMLEVVGNSLWIAYPRQCLKLLILLRNHYYPQIQNSGGVGGGPAARLGKFLNDSIARSFIPPPDGQLPPNFW